jgi:LmbE family N-acetylglucosaminyl deacetylase
VNARFESPVIVVSPHLDDAVLSCGRVLAVTSAMVATFFAGRPSAGTPLTPWDQAAGFQADDDQIGIRTAEDDAALKVLGATATRFGFIDAQYRCGPAPVAEMTDALGDLLDCVEPRSVLLPAGNGHADHLACLHAGLPLLPMRSSIAWFIYEDGTYPRGLPLPPERLLIDGTPDAVARPCALPFDADPELKRMAIACYRSQVRAFLHYRRRLLAEAEIDEQYWRLELAPSASRIAWSDA